MKKTIAKKLYIILSKKRNGKYLISLEDHAAANVFYAELAISRSYKKAFRFYKRMKSIKSVRKYAKSSEEKGKIYDIDKKRFIKN